MDEAEKIEALRKLGWWDEEDDAILRIERGFRKIEDNLFDKALRELAKPRTTLDRT